MQNINQKYTSRSLEIKDKITEKSIEISQLK